MPEWKVGEQQHSNILGHHKDLVYFIWIQEGFTAEPPRNDSGAEFQGNDSVFGPKVRVTGQKSELQAESRSYSGSDPQNPNRMAQKRNPKRVKVLLQKTPLKAFLNPPKVYCFFLPCPLGSCPRAPTLELVVKKVGTIRTRKITGWKNCFWELF